MEATIILDTAFNPFLATFFAGISLQSKDKELTKVADTNFRRIYKHLTIDEKKMVQAEVSEYKNTPGLMDKRIEDMLKFLEQYK